MKIFFGYIEPEDIVTINHRFRLRHTFQRLVIFSTIITIVSFFVACENRGAKEVAITKDPDVYYTCSMHPNVMQEKPGNCPICGMKLIEAKKSQTQKPDEIQ